VKFVAALTGVVLLGVGATAAAGTGPSLPDSVVRTLQAPDRVESFLLDPDDLLSREKAKLGRIEHWAIIEVGPDLSPEGGGQMARLLLDPAGFLEAGPRSVKQCVFSPRHALRFTQSGSTPVEVIVCFACSQLRVRTSDGSFLWSGGFDPMERELLGLFRAIAPTWKF
jgi:hypothetical protein